MQTKQKPALVAGSAPDSVFADVMPDSQEATVKSRIVNAVKASITCVQVQRWFRTTSDGSRTAFPHKAGTSITSIVRGNCVPQSRNHLGDKQHLNSPLWYWVLNFCLKMAMIGCTWMMDLLSMHPDVSLRILANIHIQTRTAKKNICFQRQRQIIRTCSPLKKCQTCCHGE